MIVGVAGKYCSGKTTVTSHLVDRGFIEINLDRLGHAALDEAAEQVADLFGEIVLNSSGGVDRQKLGSIVFEDARKRLLLENLLHPRMVEMTRESLTDYTGGDVVIDGALLFYMGVDRLCDIAFWVTAPPLVRFFRAVKRDKLPVVSLLKRFRAQKDLTPQPSSNAVDIYYIRNTGSPSALKERLDRILPRERM